MKAIDLTQEISEATPVWPGDPRLRIESAATIARDGCALSTLALSTHSGTHIDAPAHLIPGAKALSDFPAEAFVGPALAIHCECAPWGQITLEMLAPFEEALRAVDFALLSTGWARRWGAEGYFSGYPTLTHAALELLTGLRLKGVGLDAPSVDPPDSTDYPVHRALLSTGILIIENLADLGRLPPAPFLFACLPLKIAGADGAPCRAVAMV